MSPRKRSRHTGYLGEPELRQLRPRFGLDNQARSQSTAPHNRRKPTVGGVGTPELAENAVTGGKIANNSLTKDHVAGGGWGKDAVPQIDQLNGTLKAKDAGWADGKDFIPSDAIKGVNWDKIGSVPNFAKQGDIDNSVADVKKWANKRFKKA